MKSLPHALPVAATASCLLLLAIAATPVQASGSPTPQPLADIPLFGEDFEGAFPGSWTVTGDADSYNGSDYWGSTTTKPHAGAGSVWSAQVGDSTAFVTVFSEDFESGGMGLWSTNFDTETGGDGLADYWGPSTWQTHGGNYSMWCAQVGQNRYDSGGASSNAAIHKYDYYMNSTLYRSVNLTGIMGAQLGYWSWFTGEPCCDYAMVIYYTSAGWNYVDKRYGSSNGWVYRTVDLPSDTTAVGFLWYADVSIDLEGLYVDDVTVTGTRVNTNVATGQYDDGVNATIYHSVDVSGYTDSRLDFSYWMDTAGTSDYLLVLYYAGDWYPALQLSSAGGGWLLGSASLPRNATRIGFRFIADSTGHGQGVYLDDVRVYGYIAPPECYATVDNTTGIEAATAFHYQATATGGLPLYRYSWQFGDGANSTSPSPRHPYQAVGNYTAVLTVTDSLGQTCEATAPSVRVFNDLTAVSVTPTITKITEGDTVEFSAADNRGHALPAFWRTTPDCGEVNPSYAITSVFSSSKDSGGLTCSVSATIESTTGTATVLVGHNVSVVSVTPATATVVEGMSLGLDAADANGHPLAFVWSATCGRVTPDTGAHVTFSAIVTGGLVCTVTAAWESTLARATVVIVHDTSAITIAPASSIMRAGGMQTFSATDLYGHPFLASWTVEPVECGTFNETEGPVVSFAARTSAGGLHCSVVASFGDHRKSVSVDIDHDTTTFAISPDTATLLEGGSQSFAAGDRFGYALIVDWVVTPSSCGALSALNGSSTVLSVSPQAGGTACTVIARYSGASRIASLLVAHGSAASVSVSPAFAEVEEGRSGIFYAAVLDASGHDLGALVITWSTDCGALSGTTGASVSFQVPRTAAGTTCTVTASHAAFSSTSHVSVTYALPFTVTITSTGGGSAQVFTATVTDAMGNKVPNAEFRWASNCGVVSPTTGPSTTFTPPGDGKACTVTAETTVGQEVAGGGTASTAVASNVLPIAVIVVAAVAAIAVFILFRRKKAGAPPVE